MSGRYSREAVWMSAALCLGALSACATHRAPPSLDETYFLQELPCVPVKSDGELQVCPSRPPHSRPLAVNGIEV